MPVPVPVPMAVCGSFSHCHAMVPPCVENMVRNLRHANIILHCRRSHRQQQCLRSHDGLILAVAFIGDYSFYCNGMLLSIWLTLREHSRTIAPHTVRVASHNI